MSINLRLALNLSSLGGASSLDPATAAFLARVSSQTVAQQNKYDRFIRALKTAGIWTKMDAVYLFKAAEAATGLTNLVSSSFNCTAVGSPTFTANVGYSTGSTSDYLNSGYNPSTPSGLCKQNDAHISYWNVGTAQSTGDMAGMASGGWFYSQPRFTDNSRGGRLFTSGGSSLFTTAVGTASGHHCHVKTAASTQAYYYNGGEYTGNDATDTNQIDNSTIVFLKGTDGFNPGPIAAATIGSQLTSAQNTALHAALRDFVADIFIVAHGDSMTYGSNLATPDVNNLTWSRSAAAKLYASKGLIGASYRYGSPSAGFCPGVVGNGTVDTLTITDSAAANIDPYASYPNVRLAVFGGTNDMWFQLGDYDAATTYSYFIAYIQARIAAGWAANKIYALTTLPRQANATFETRRQSFCSLVAAGAATYGYNVVRLDLDTAIGDSGDQNDTTYYQGDTIHPKGGVIEATNGMNQIATDLLAVIS